MQTRSLGPGAPAVSVVGYGAMPLSIQGRPSDEAAAVRALHAGIEAGMTFVDTADVYCLDDGDRGHNERLVARALASWRGRERVWVGTKGGMARPEGRWERHGPPDVLRRACEASLRALGTDCIDLYQLHAPDPKVPFADQVGMLADLQREGKIRHIGLSNVFVDEIEEARKIAPIASVQNRLNPFFRESLERGVVAHCAEHGIGFLAYSPVGGGRLNKKLPDHPVLREIAARHGASPHAVVIAWVLAQGPTVIAIPGARTPEHARDSASAAALELSPEDLRAIDEAGFSTD